QKMVIARTGEGVVAYCGGSDIANHRLGRDGYTGPPISDDDLKKNSGLGEFLNAPWHDVQVKVVGPAVADLWQAFVLRFETVKASRAGFPTLPPVSQVLGASSLLKPETQHTQQSAGNANLPLDVQVARTFANFSGSHVAGTLV